MLTLSLTNIIKFDSAVSTEHSPGPTNKSLDIGIENETNIDLNTIAGIYIVFEIYSNDFVSICISTASTSIASTIATITFMNPDLKYANQKYSLHNLQELESKMILTYSTSLSQPNVVCVCPSYLQFSYSATMTIYYM